MKPIAPRTGRHSFLPGGRHSCPPACSPACRHAGIPALECWECWECSRVDTGQNAKEMATRSGKERHKLPRQRQMLPRNGKGIQPLRKSPFFAGETVGTPACLRTGILASPPACLPLCLPAGTQAYRQRYGGNAKGRSLFQWANDRKSGGKGGQRTPQAATTTPNAATQRQRDTTLAKVIFLCRRNGWHAGLPARLREWMAADRTKKRMSNK